MIEGISSSLINFSGCSGLSGCSVSSDARQNKREQNSNKTQNISSKDTDSTGLRLTDEQKKEVEELKKRDQEVRTHEQAHMAAGGDLASPASYTTVKGPDNKTYATGGEVQIDVSPVEGNPEKTIEKARRVRNAAMAPANPSGQDLQVASQATQMEAQARIDKNSEKNSNNTKKSEGISTAHQQYGTTSNLLEGLSQNAIIAGAFSSPFSLVMPFRQNNSEGIQGIQYTNETKNLKKFTIPLQQDKNTIYPYVISSIQKTVTAPSQKEVANLYANNSTMNKSKEDSSISISM